jgi:ERCC4-type nuclease
VGIVRSLEAKLIVDRREHEALVFPAGTPLTWGHLYAGRYSIEGYERRVAVEHMTLSSLARAVSRDRSRLWARLERMCWLDAAALVVSASMPEMMLHGYSSRVMPPCVLGSCNAIMIDFGIPVVWAGNRGCAAQMVASFLRLAARRMDESREEVHNGP